MKKLVILLITALMLSNATFALAGSDGMYENYNDDYKFAMDMLSEISAKGNTVVLKESSLNIEVPNIDLELYIQTEKDRVLGKNPRESRLLSVDIIDDIMNLYPELEEVDLEKWTYAKFDEYDRLMTCKKGQPTELEAKRLKERGISLSDAKALTKEYGSYKVLLEKTDNEIKEAITKIYLINLEAAKNLVVEPIQYDTMNTRGPVTPPDNSTAYTFLSGADGTLLKYYECYVPGYQYYPDWFLVDSETHKYDNNVTYGNGVQLIYNALYNTSQSYSASNLWGTYASEAKWPHEGLDLIKSSGCLLYAPFSDDPAISGDATLKNIPSDLWGKIVFNCGIGYNEYTVTLLHTGSPRISPSQSPFSVDTPIGTESGYGANSLPSDFKHHTHFSVRKGNDTTTDEYDRYLTSDNPYIFAFRHFD